ncbi:MAG: lipoprotein LpqH [Mycobacterium sp.]
MDNRLVATVAVALAAAAAGCSTPPAALGGTTAKVTIDGKSTGDAHAVVCSQTGWMWNIKTAGEPTTLTAFLNTNGEVSVQSVDFRDFGGFTGIFWQGRAGEAEVTGQGGRFTITGSADGSFKDNPSNAVTATFRIEANC